MVEISRLNSDGIQVCTTYVLCDRIESIRLGPGVARIVGYPEPLGISPNAIDAIQMVGIGGVNYDMHRFVDSIEPGLEMIEHPAHPEPCRTRIGRFINPDRLGDIERAHALVKCGRFIRIDGHSLTKDIVGHVDRRLRWRDILPNAGRENRISEITSN